MLQTVQLYNRNLVNWFYVTVKASAYYYQSLTNGQGSCGTLGHTPSSMSMPALVLPQEELLAQFLVPA